MKLNSPGLLEAFNREWESRFKTIASEDIQITAFMPTSYPRFLNSKRVIMSSKQKLALFIFCVAVMQPKAEVALIPGSEPLRQMFADATLVCRCSVLSIKILRKEKIPGDLHGNIFNVMSALLKEEKIYKADHKGFKNITVIYDEYPFSSGVGLEGGEYDRLFFLKATGSNYGFVEPRMVFQLPSAPSVEGSGIEQLERDLIAGLETSDRSSLFKYAAPIAGPRQVIAELNFGFEKLVAE
jgi:hypothetical protein